MQTNNNTHPLLRANAKQRGDYLKKSNDTTPPLLKASCSLRFDGSPVMVYVHKSNRALSWCMPPLLLLISPSAGDVEGGVSISPMVISNRIRFAEECAGTPQQGTPWCIPRGWGLPTVSLFLHHFFFSSKKVHKEPHHGMHCG